jgi:hypothetical protein
MRVAGVDVPCRSPLPSRNTAHTGATKKRGKLMEKLLRTIKHELHEVIPPTVFFFITFCLVLSSEKLILKEYGIPFSALASAAVGALLVGKVVLIVDHLSFVNKFPDKPLMYNVTWKTVLYLIAALFVRYVEHLVPFVIKYRNVMEANGYLWDEIVWSRFWLIQLWLSVLLFVFCALRELIRVIGRDQVIRIFFGSRG